MATDAEIQSEYSDLFRDYMSHWSSWMVQARRDLEMHLGDHFTREQIVKAAAAGRTLIPFNKTARQVDLLHGYEIQNRHILKIGGTGEEDDAAAAQHTGLIMQQMAQGGYDCLSECFKWGSMVCGSNLCDIYDDRDGLRRFRRRPYNSFLLDPAFKEPDLSDCRNILTGQWMHEDNCKLLLPTKADKIDKIPSVSGSRWRDNPNFARQEYMRLYEEWWGLRTEFVPFVIDHLTGQDEEFEQFKRRFSNDARAANYAIETGRNPRGGPIWSKYSKNRRKVILRVFVDDVLVWQGDNPTGLDDYNFVWLGGEYCPEMPNEQWKLRSLSRRLRDPQAARDMRLNQAIDIIESAVQAGKVVREGALVNPEDAYKSGQGVVITVSDEWHPELPVEAAIKQFGGPAVNPGIFHLIDLLDNEETESVGLNRDAFGLSEGKDEPFVLSKHRTAMALTAQQPLFQRYRRAKRILGIKMVKMNQKMSARRVQRQLNEEPAQGFYDPDFTRFDCTPTEGRLTDSQRALYYEEIKELYAQFPEIIPASLVIKAAPTQFPQKVIQAIMQREQQQAQMMAAELQTKQMMDKMLLAQAQLDAAKAEGEIAGAGLDRVKAMSEIQKLQAEPKLALADKYLQYMKIVEDSKKNARTKKS